MRRTYLTLPTTGAIKKRADDIRPYGDRKFEALCSKGHRRFTALVSDCRSGM